MQKFIYFKLKFLWIWVFLLKCCWNKNLIFSVVRLLYLCRFSVAACIEPYIFYSILFLRFSFLLFEIRPCAFFSAIAKIDILLDTGAFVSSTPLSSMHLRVIDAASSCEYLRPLSFLLIFIDFFHEFFANFRSFSGRGSSSAVLAHEKWLTERWFSWIPIPRTPSRITVCIKFSKFESYFQKILAIFCREERLVVLQTNPKFGSSHEKLVILPVYDLIREVAEGGLLEIVR